ncbi:hypothetical protein P261_00908 [Lachnospiraceae bacterium TWA4]|nr:hypothetical protein P261_00908 [Lachnospiraceae bacterium TWA4]
MVYQSLHGILVALENTIERRFYRDYYTGDILACLEDDGSKKVLSILKESKLTELEFLNCLAFEKTMYENNRFILHSSFIETKYGAILFTAPSGTGKSTQAELWRTYRNVDVINGDRSGLWKEGNQWMAGGVPWCGTSGIMKNKTLPLKAIVILEQALENCIQEINYGAKVGRILEQLTVNPWNSEMLVAAKMFSMYLAKEVPIIKLLCRPDLGAVETLEKELERYGYGE